MEKIKELINKGKKKIKKSFLVQLIKFKSTVKDLESKIGELEKEKQKLNDKVHLMEDDLKRLNELKNKVPSMELVIASSDKSLKSKIEEIEHLKLDMINLQNEVFIAKNELATANIQKEEYEAQIKELKSERYLIKKVRSGRKPNTNKTKISRPMANKVVKYMRGEHE